MTRTTLRAALAALLAALPTLPALAQDPALRVDSLFRFATAETPGCAVGVSQQGRVLVNRAYGLADLEKKTPIGPATRFDIGSTQKQFTAAAILLLAEDGRLKLTDDIRKHLPELPDLGRVVTVDHLLTHTGGIRDWTGLLPLAPKGTDVAALLRRQRGLNFAPGTEWSYSNGGYELAKSIVAKASGMPFAEFARTRLFAPLGMTSSAYVPDILQAGGNVALGYQQEGAGWKPYMRLGNNRGGGAIVSTIGDMLKWNDALATAKLGKAVTAKLQEPAKLANGRTLSYARGLIVETNRGRRMVWHSGGAAGYSAAMTRFPEHGLSVAVSCNFDPVSATALAARVADHFLPAPAEQNAGPVAAQGVDPSGRAGLYLDERTGEPMRLAMGNGRLQIANGPSLVPVSATSFRPPRADPFFRSQDDFVLSFPDSARIEIRSQEGQVTRYRRAQPFTPAAGELQSVDGRYESAELGAVYEIVPGPNGIVMRQEGAPDRAMTMTPVERDAYMFRMMIVRFRRDASGTVTGFAYSNPLAKGLAFTRVGDRRTAAGAHPAPAAAAAPSLDGLAGEYEVAPGRYVTVTLERGQLFGQPTGGQRYRLVHTTGITYSAEGTPITLTFNLDAAGRATSALMRQGDRERTLPKVK